MDCEVVESTGSTNDDLVARARARAPERAILRAADAQTAGRGRRGRAWHGGAPGSSLLFSIAVPWHGAPAASAAATLACGLAAACCLRREGAEVAIKWPNDLLLDGRKLAGLLAEMVEDPAGRRTLVVGMGLNLCLDAAARTAAGQPIAELSEAIGPDAARAGRERRLALLASALIDAVRAFARDGFAPLRAEFGAHLAFVGRMVRLQDALAGAPGGGPCGIVEGVDDDGRLLLQTADGLRALASGELSLRACAHEGSP